MKKIFIVLVIALFLLNFVSAQLDDSNNNTPEEVIDFSQDVEDSDKADDTTIQETSKFSQILSTNTRKIAAGVVVLILLIIVIKIAKRSPKPEKLYNQAESLHKEAKEFHDDGDDETAQELYEKAEGLRDKARELESSGV